MKLPLSSAVCALTLVFSIPSHAALLGVTFAGDVYSISETTAAGTLIDPSGVERLNSLTEDGAGGFLSAVSAPPAAGGGGELVSINSSTGVGTIGASIDLGITPVSIRALAVSPTGVLFASNNPDPGSVTAISQLYTLNATSGVGTLIGEMGVAGMQALAFEADGTLYGWNGGGLPGSTTVGLVTLNTATGLATDVDPSVDAQGFNLQSIAFGLDGTTLFGAEGNALYTIDQITGIATLVGTGSYSDIRGLAAVVPVPAAVWLFGSGLLGLIGMARRKKT